MYGSSKNFIRTNIIFIYKYGVLFLRLTQRSNKMKPKDILTKEFLIEHFVNQRKSDKTIAQELKLKSHHSVFQARQRHSVYRSSLKDSSHIITKEFLEEYYVRQNMTLKQVAQQAGFQRKSIVSNALKKFKIPQREHTKSFAFINRKPRKHHTISGRYFCSLISGAKRRNLSFDITLDQLWNLYVKQNKKCALSGLDIGFHKPGERYTCQTASVDRIDSEQGYVLSNVRWVHKTVNAIKWELSDDELIAICKKIIQYNRKKV